MIYLPPDNKEFEHNGVLVGVEKWTGQYQIDEHREGDSILKVWRPWGSRNKPLEQWRWYCRNTVTGAKAEGTVRITRSRGYRDSLLKAVDDGLARMRALPERS